MSTPVPLRSDSAVTLDITLDITLTPSAVGPPALALARRRCTFDRVNEQSDRPSQPRIEPITEFDGDLEEILAGALTHNGTPLNIFGTLGHHPKLLKRFNLLGGFLLNKGLIPPRERELVILRVGANARSVYEFGQHTLIGLECGLSQPEIDALVESPDSHDWSPADRALIALADDLHADDCVSDATWTELAERWSEAELAELLVVAGFYRLVSGFLNSTGVALDSGVPGWPTR